MSKHRILSDISTAAAADDLERLICETFPDARVVRNDWSSRCGRSTYFDVWFEHARAKEIRVSDHGLGPKRFGDYILVAPGDNSSAVLAALSKIEGVSRNVERSISQTVDAIETCGRLDEISAHPRDAGRARKILRETGAELVVNDSVIRRALDKIFGEQL